MPKIMFRPAPTPPPFVPPTPIIPDNAFVFHGLTEGSIVTANYNYWHERWLQVHTPYEDERLQGITLYGKDDDDNYFTIYVYVRANNVLEGYLESNLENPQVTEVEWYTDKESSGYFDNYVIVIL